MLSLNLLTFWTILETLLIWWHILAYITNLLKGQLGSHKLFRYSNVQGVQQNWSHFVICNFSSPLTAWIKSNDIFEMPFQFSFGKCPNMSRQLEIKINIFKNISTKGPLWMMVYPHWLVVNQFKPWGSEPFSWRNYWTYYLVLVGLSPIQPHHSHPFLDHCLG